MDKKIVIALTLISLLPLTASSQNWPDHIVIDKGYEELTGRPVSQIQDSLFAYENGAVRFFALPENMFFIDSTLLQASCMENRLYSGTYLCHVLYRRFHENSQGCAIGYISSESDYIGDKLLNSYIYFFKDESIIVPRFSGRTEFFGDRPVDIQKVFSSLQKDMGNNMVPRRTVDQILWEDYFCDRPVEMLSLFLHYANKHSMEDSLIKRYMFDLMLCLEADNRWFRYKQTSVSMLQYDPGHQCDYSALKAFLYGHPILGASSRDLMEAVREFSGFARQWYRETPKRVADMEILSSVVMMLAIANPPSYRLNPGKNSSWFQSSGKLENGA